MPCPMLPALQRQLQHIDGVKLCAGDGVTKWEGEYLPLTDSCPTGKI